MGLTFAGDEQGGAFISVFGWGSVPTTFIRSEDGLDWTQNPGAVNTPAGVAYGGGVALLGTKKGWHSTDRGQSWREGGEAEIIHSGTGESVFNTRKILHVPTMGGRFILTASSGKTRDDGTRYEVWGVSFTADGGATWAQPQAPDECGFQLVNVIGDSQRMIMTHNKGLVCVSTDGGLTLAAHQVDVDADTFGRAQGTPIHDGQRFWIWGRRTAYSSTDGITWERHERAQDFHLGATVYDPHHEVFVAVRGGWKQWYDRQEFYRSADGIAWEQLDEGAFTKSHLIRHIAFGWAKPGTTCPTP